jgi:ABC-type uncharacterized transport system permease subunit
MMIPFQWERNLILVITNLSGNYSVVGDQSWGVEVLGVQVINFLVVAVLLGLMMATGWSSR